VTSLHLRTGDSGDFVYSEAWQKLLQASVNGDITERRTHRTHI